MSSATNCPFKVSKVAVIGAGAAGLAAARELSKEFDVEVLEQSDDVGGVWQYTFDVEEGVHSSLYASLRTNLPREVIFVLWV